MRFTNAASSGTLLGCLIAGTTALQGNFFGDSSNLRQVKAAHRVRDLARRRSEPYEIHRTYGLDMVFTEAENLHGNSVFGASVQVESKVPLLNLEDFDHLLESVHCSEAGEKMDVVFKHDESWKMARRELGDFESGMIITSHQTCNEDGERRPFEVHVVNFIEESRAVKLEVQPKSWKRAFQRYNIEFGEYQESHIHRRNHDLLPRHLKLTHMKKDLSSHLPTNTSSATSVSLDLGHHMGGPGSNFNFPIGPNVPFQIGCENCTTAGTLKLTHGVFHIRTPSISDIEGMTLADFIQGGFVEFELDGFMAHVLLHAIPTSTADLTVDLFSIPVVGIAIPGVVSVGLTFLPQLAASFTVQSQIKFLMGFNLQVPDGATIRTDLSHLGQSGQTGFETTKFEVIPLQAISNPPSLNIAVSFRPRFTLGFSSPDDDVTADVGVFVDLPQLSTTITQVSSADAHCKPLPANKLNTLQKFEHNLFTGNLTRIENSVNLNLGVDATLAAPKLGSLGTFTTSATLLSTQFPLPSACVSFDEKQKRFVPATKVLARATATATAFGGAAAALKVPYAGNGVGAMDSLLGVVVFLAGLVVAV